MPEPGIREPRFGPRSVNRARGLHRQQSTRAAQQQVRKASRSPAPIDRALTCGSLRARRGGIVSQRHVPRASGLRVSARWRHFASGQLTGADPRSQPSAREGRDDRLAPKRPYARSADGSCPGRHVDHELRIGGLLRATGCRATALNFHPLQCGSDPPAGLPRAQVVGTHNAWSRIHREAASGDVRDNSRSVRTVPRPVRRLGLACGAQARRRRRPDVRCPIRNNSSAKTLRLQEVQSVRDTQHFMAGPHQLDTDFGNERRPGGPAYSSTGWCRTDAQQIKAGRPRESRLCATRSPAAPPVARTSAVRLSLRPAWVRGRLVRSLFDIPVTHSRRLP